MEELFKFPLRLYTDSGTIRIEQANGETIIPEMLWNGERPHYELQLKRAHAILGILNNSYDHPVSSNFCEDEKTNKNSSSGKKKVANPWGRHGKPK